MPPPSTIQPVQMIQPLPVQPIGQTAIWTGQSTQVRTITGAMAWQCEYSFGSRRFLLLFESFCPSSTQVQ